MYPNNKYQPIGVKKKKKATTHTISILAGSLARKKKRK